MKFLTSSILFLFLSASTVYAQEEENGGTNGGNECEPGQCVSVPEPSTLSLFALGIAAFGTARYLRNKK